MSGDVGQGTSAGATGGQESGQNYEQHFDSIRKELGETKRQASGAHQKLSQIESIFNPKQEAKQQRQWFDSMLGDLIQQKAQGRDLPMTSTLAVELDKAQRELEEFKASYEEMKKQFEIQNNPETQFNNDAYRAMDNMMTDMLGRLYPGEENENSRRYLGEAVTNDIVSFLNELRQEDPRQWQEIRRNPASLKKIVEYHINDKIPPAARKVITEKYEASQPFTFEDAKEALDEALQIPKSNPQRAKVIEIARQKYFELMGQRNGLGRRS